MPLTLRSSNNIGKTIDAFTQAHQLDESIEIDLRGMERVYTQAVRRLGEINSSRELSREGKDTQRAAVLATLPDALKPWHDKRQQYSARIAEEEDKAMRHFARKEHSIVDELRDREVRDRLMAQYSDGGHIDRLQLGAVYIAAIERGDDSLRHAIEGAPPAFGLVSDDVLAQGRALLIERAPQAHTIKQLKVVVETYDYVIGSAEREIAALASE